MIERDDQFNAKFCCGGFCFRCLGLQENVICLERQRLSFRFEAPVNLSPRYFRYVSMLLNILISRFLESCVCGSTVPHRTRKTFLNDQITERGHRDLLSPKRSCLSQLETTSNQKSIRIAVERTERDRKVGNENCQFDIVDLAWTNGSRHKMLLGVRWRTRVCVTKRDIGAAGCDWERVDLKWQY